MSSPNVQRKCPDKSHSSSELQHDSEKRTFELPKNSVIIPKRKTLGVKLRDCSFCKWQTKCHKVLFCALNRLVEVKEDRKSRAQSQHITRKEDGIFVRKQLHIFNRCNFSFYSYLIAFSCTNTERSKRKHRIPTVSTVGGG